VRVGLPPTALASLSVEDAAYLTQWTLAQMRRVQRDPMTYGHPPHEIQEELHCSEAQEVMLLASNRIGKSEGGTREYLWRARGNHPYKRTRRHRVIWVGCPTYNFYEETTRPKFDEWCPPDWIDDYSEQKKIAYVRHEDGGICRIHFKTYDQGRKKWQGAGVDHLWLDEEPPEDIFREGYARIISTRGSIHLTFTAVEGLGWWYDRIYTPAKQGRGRWHVIEGALAQYEPDAYLNVGRILVPHMTAEDVIRFAEAYPDEDERLSRVFGQPRARTGAVYKAFRAEIHSVPAFEVPKHWDVWGAVDPGFHGFGFLLLGISPTGRIYILEEYFSQEELTSTRLAAMAELVKRHRPHWWLDAKLIEDEQIAVFVDTEDPQVVLELNVKAAETKVPLGFVPLNQGLKARKAGILRVQEYLAPHPTRATPIEVQRPRPEAGEPLLYLLDSLHSEWKVKDEPHQGSRLAYELGKYLWAKKKADRKDDADETTADGAHLLAALRYAIAARVGLPQEPPDDPLKGLPQNEAAVHAEFLRLRDARGEHFEPFAPD